MKFVGAQNQAFSGGGGKYFPVWAGNILPSPQEDPVVAPAGSVLRAWLSQALDFWAKPARRPIRPAKKSGSKLGVIEKRTRPEATILLTDVLNKSWFLSGSPSLPAKFGPGNAALRGLQTNLWEQTQSRLKENVGANL
jgi:hypothetical protein